MSDQIAMSTPSLIFPLLAFGAVVALIPIALWLLKRTPLGAGAGQKGLMRVVANLPLAPNQRLVTVEVGSGDDRRWLVLGVSPSGIQALHQLPPQPEPAAVGMAGSPLGQIGQSFAQALARQRSGGDPRAR